jgi:ABC-type nitrate/sulfonate/bicarbonate transport system ATPase subunit
LSKLEDWIASNEIVLIHAPDGMGKSALLRQAADANRHADNHADGLARRRCICVLQ